MQAISAAAAVERACSADSDSISRTASIYTRKYIPPSRVRACVRACMRQACKVRGSVRSHTCCFFRAPPVHAFVRGPMFAYSVRQISCVCSVLPPPESPAVEGMRDSFVDNTKSLASPFLSAAVHASVHALFHSCTLVYSQTECMLTSGMLPPVPPSMLQSTLEKSIGE